MPHCAPPETLASFLALPHSHPSLFGACLTSPDFRLQSRAIFAGVRHRVAGVQACRVCRIGAHRELVLDPYKNPRMVRACPDGLHSSQPPPCSDRFKGLWRLLPHAMLPALQAMGVMHPWVWSRLLRMGATAHGPIDFNDEF
jgi:hypothetical protein